MGVFKKNVEKREQDISESEIIDYISGGDQTEGSCASLALTYIANKMGYDVLDFRGGSSRAFFARISTEIEISKMLEKFNPGSVHQVGAENGIDSAKQALEFVEEG